MRRQPWRIVIPLAILSASAAGAKAGGPEGGAADFAEVQALTAAIDRSLADGWEAAGVEPAPPSDDAEFLRRVCLDLTGRIPKAAEARDFLDDPGLDKRRALVDRLLAGPGYAAQMASIWKDLLIPEAESNRLIQIYATDFENWLRRAFAEGLGHDRIARGLLTTRLEMVPRTTNTLGIGEPSPIAFYAAKDVKPENLADSTAQLFLGLRLGCAQCHDHPFDTWRRDQFWGYAAFFAGIERTGPVSRALQIREVADRRELTIPGTDRVVRATFLDGGAPRWQPEVGARETLADWVTSPENPYFARAAVNRTWAQLFGTGLVDPVDDLGPDNPPSHPELLDELARRFVANGFDHRFLIRAITASRAYQLSSAGYDPDRDNPRLFARLAVRALTPLQLYEALLQASGLPREPDRGPAVIATGSMRAEFLERFASQGESAVDRRTSILQALTLMNGRLLAEATNPDRGPTLLAVATAPFLDAPAKIEALYLSSLTRRPRPEELDRLVAYVDAAGPEPEVRSALKIMIRAAAHAGPSSPREKALADVFWALLNSAEFVLNH